MKKSSINMNLPKVPKYTIIAVVAVLVLVLVGVFVMRPLILNINSLASEIQEKESILESEKAQAEYLKTQEETLKEIAPYLPKIFNSLPSKKEIASFVVSLEGLAAETNNSIKTIQITEAASTTKEKKTSEKSEFSQTVKNGDIYEIPFELTLIGDFPSLQNFMGNFEKMNRFSEIKFISAKQTDKGLETSLKGNTFLKP